MALFGAIFGSLLSLLPIPREAGHAFIIVYMLMPLCLTSVAQRYFGEDEPTVTLYRLLESIIYRNKQ